MSKPQPDEWMLQLELRESIDATGLPPLRDEMLVVHQRNETLINRKYVYPFLVSNGWSKRSLETPWFQEDLKKERRKLITSDSMNNNTQFLSPSVRNLGLTRIANTYRSNEDKILSRRDFSRSVGRKTEEIAMHMSLVTRVLESYKEALIVCIQSFRYSERFPHELGLELGRTRRTGSTWVYEYEVVSHDGLEERMNTLAFLNAKLIVRPAERVSPPNLSF